MAIVSYDISTAFLARMRAVMVDEQPGLQGQSNAVINEAARIRVRDMVRDWVLNYERNAASQTASNNVPVPGDLDIA